MRNIRLGHNVEDHTKNTLWSVPSQFIDELNKNTWHLTWLSRKWCPQYTPCHHSILSCFLPRWLCVHGDIKIWLHNENKRSQIFSVEGNTRLNCPGLFLKLVLTSDKIDMLLEANLDASVQGAGALWRSRYEQ